MELRLYGYRYSVYTRIARMALAMRELSYETCEVNPFDTPRDPELAHVTPFQRVPVLDHDGFQLFETSAITRYVATRFPGPALVPDGAPAAARMEQVIALIDAHGYIPLVRQVFSHSVFRPLVGAPVEPEEITKGMAASVPVLQVLESIAAEGLVLVPDRVTLADLHLAPMIGYFTLAKEARTALADYPALSVWWSSMSRHPTYAATEPSLAMLNAGG